jgi:hypothetical protein
VDEPVIYLVPVGAQRFELYSEPPDEPAAAAAPPQTQGSWHRLTHRLHLRWHDAVRTARQDNAATGLFARVRDAIIRRTAEAIAEQRTLWMLRHARRATLVHPSDLSGEQATAIRARMLAHAGTHHVRWLAFDGVAFVVSGVLVIVPGPNLIAYYFAFRLIGHYFSWRGARRAAQAAWDLRSEPALAELGRLADLPRDARASRVDAIAAALRLPSLAAFFDRTAVPARS